jgi:hypothetical protein
MDRWLKGIGQIGLDIVPLLGYFVFRQKHFDLFHVRLLSELIDVFRGSLAPAKLFRYPGISNQSPMELPRKGAQ